MKESNIYTFSEKENGDFKSLQPSDLSSFGKMKKIFIFDLDGTLTESKADVDDEMSELMCRLLWEKKVAVVTGGTFKQLLEQLLSHIECNETFLNNLVVLATSGSSFYIYEKNGWHPVYENILSAKDKILIKNTFDKVFKEISYTQPIKVYGQVIEDRETQMTFSALGQDAPLEKKERWNEKKDRRLEIKSALEQYLSEFEVRLGGLTSIDVTKKGVDKAYAVKQIMKQFGLSINDMIFIGDSFYEGGNDLVVLKTGIDAMAVSGPAETKLFISIILSKYL
jgi:phosphomannomutase